MRVLGVDPGTLATGWGVISVAGRALTHVEHGVIRTQASDPLWVRLQVIHRALVEVIERLRPDALALEQCFVSKNIQSALKLGHTRGAVMIAASAGQVAIAEYTASQVKATVGGGGRASKQQMQEMVRVHLRLGQLAPEDASDALAAAICHAQAAAFQRALAGAR
ncbi:MAG: crossover junction endodeoxyribonuclease RuvC [Deltaproteobacteria bacterium]|nr:crossover junction endodeoxyribonuclease RuvC [Deltaproteobacteria bacterium]